MDMQLIRHSHRPPHMQWVTDDQHFLQFLFLHELASLHQVLPGIRRAFFYQNLRGRNAFSHRVLTGRG